MNARLLVIFALVASGCLPRIVEQTTLTQTRVQDGVVMAPMAPMGVGASLPTDSASLAGGVSLTATQSVDDAGNSQAAIPFGPLVRGALGLGDSVDLAIHSDLAIADVDAGPIAERVRDDTRGVLGRGGMQLRTFVPNKSMLELGFDFEAGLEGSLRRHTDLTTLEVKDTWGTTVDSWSSNETAELRLHPRFGTGVLLRVPIPVRASITGFARMGVQTWPVYWSQRTQVDQCTTYFSGREECTKTGSISVAPSPLKPVWTPSGGATFRAGPQADIHVQGYANFGQRAVEEVPWGAMVLLEARSKPPE